MINSNLNILVQLAHVDGEVSEIEKSMIYDIGRSNGLTDDEIKEAFNIAKPIGDLSLLNDDKKFEHIYDIVKLMMADGKIIREEIAFCSKLAFKLGYHESVLSELINDIHFKELSKRSKDDFKEKVQQFLR